MIGDHNLAVHAGNHSRDCVDQRRSLKGREGEAVERGEVLRLWREGPQTTGVPQQNNNDTDRSSGTHRSGVRSEPDSWQVGKLERPMEPVAPADNIKVDRPITCSYDPENTLVVSAITPYQLVRHLMAPITLADSITVSKKTVPQKVKFHLSAKLWLI